MEVERPEERASRAREARSLAAQLRELVAPPADEICCIIYYSQSHGSRSRRRHGGLSDETQEELAKLSETARKELEAKKMLADGRRPEEEARGR